MSQKLDIQKFPLRGSHLIEASAGTGKTFTIALLYVRLILGHGGDFAFDRELLPTEVLVVTFTEAASMELRARIRERLAQAARVFANDEPLNPADPLADIIAAYPPEQHAACAHKLQRAAEWMDEAAVSTIHSWCYRMLREHAFNSGSLFSNTLVEDHSDLWQEVVEDIWRRHLYQSALSQAVIELIHQQWKTPEVFSKLLKTISRAGVDEYRYNGAPLAGSNNLQQQGEKLQQLCEQQHEFELKLHAALQQHYTEVVDCLETAWPNLNGRTYGTSFAAKYQALFERWLQTGCAEFDLNKFTPQGFVVKKGKAAPDHPFFALIEPWAALAGQIAHEQQQLEQILICFAQTLSREATELFERQLLARAELGFDDLLRRLAQALAGPQGQVLAEIIRRQFPIAFIDEFQDTDPLQYQIFERIYAIADNRRDCCFVMIGDPKQAIYAFRGADIYTYLQARADTAGRHYTLDKNFRSTDALVTAVNGFFERAESKASAKAFRFAHGDTNPVPFEAVASAGRRERLLIDGVQPAAINVWFDREIQSQKQFRAKMSEIAAAHIVDCLNKAQQGAAYFEQDGQTRVLHPKDIAVLVRSSTEAQAIRDALAARKVASVYLSNKDSVFESLEAQEVYLWLQAVWYASDERALRAAIATPSLGISDALLAHYADDEMAWEVLVNQVRGYRERWLKLGVLPMLQQWLHDFKVASFLLAQPNGERCLTNILHISEWLQQRSSSLDSPLALIELLQQAIAEPPPEHILRLESDDDLVKVVTIHKSKGLEYPLVLLPFIGSWRTADGRHFHEPAADGFCSVLELGHRDHCKEQVDRERLDEDVRLLYVALTRARHSIWLGVAPLTNDARSTKVSLDKSGFGYVLGRGQSLESAEDIRRALHDLAEQAGWHLLSPPENLAQCYQPPEPIALGAARTAERYYRSWWIASYSGLRYGGYGQVSALGEWDSAALERARELRALDIRHWPLLPRVEGVHSLARGARTGNTLHEMMEAYFEGRDEYDWFALEPTLTRIATRRGFNEDERRVLLDLQYALLNRPLQLLAADGTAGIEQSQLLADIGSGVVELEFWFAVNQVNTAALDQLLVKYTLRGQPRPALAEQQLNGMLKGYIDMVFEAGGRYYVLDWKSNTLGEADSDYHLQRIIEAMAESRYDLQLSLYLLALHRHLKQRLPDYDYDRHIGGALYWFVRGINTPEAGVHVERPPEEFIVALDALCEQGEPAPAMELA